MQKERRKTRSPEETAAAFDKIHKDVQAGMTQVEASKKHGETPSFYASYKQNHGHKLASKKKKNFSYTPIPLDKSTDRITISGSPEALRQLFGGNLNA